MDTTVSPRESTDSPDESKALSVSAAVALAKEALESVVVRLLGEVSEVNDKPGYKAVYFTVKDKSASLPCMMWTSRYKACGVALQVGALVELTGRFSLYAAKGRMNFDVFSITLAGEGQLRLQVAQLAQELSSLGLMNPARKRSLPLYPQTIGLVTSPRGDAVHDVLRTLRRRYPLARILFAGVPVEGAGAADALVDGLAKVVFSGAEVVLLVRGGGSFEDLMPFNDRRLARTIAACPVPVVTGIGHEPDTTIADMVADVRASTPTAAAEAVACSREQTETLLKQYGQTLTHSIQRRLDSLTLRLQQIGSRPLMVEPLRLFDKEALALDDLSDRLSRALPEGIQQSKIHVAMLETSLAQSLSHLLDLPHNNTNAVKLRLQSCGVHLLRSYQTSVDTISRQLNQNGTQLIARFAQPVAVNAARLHDLSPLVTIARGFSIARTQNNTVIRSVNDTKVGEDLTISVSDGEIDCVVTDTHLIDREIIDW